LNTADTVVLLILALCAGLAVWFRDRFFLYLISRPSLEVRMHRKERRSRRKLHRK